MTFTPLNSLDYFRQFEPQVFQFWPLLTEEQKLMLEMQLQQVNLELLEQEKQLVVEPSAMQEIAFDAFEEFAFAGNSVDQERGRCLIEQGKLGCLLLAGGQGSRLQFNGPKGCYPISIIKQKTLFQLCAEKVLAASQLAGRPLLLAIMTSPENDQETQLFFRTHNYFGLSPAQVSFFVQDTLPFLNAEGHLFLKSADQLATGADGNGHTLLHFVRSGIWSQWLQQGVEYVHVILIDNPLADPFDAELLGFHERQNVEVTLKCTEKVRADEKVGVLVKQADHFQVVEYSELPEVEKQTKRPDGKLKHCCANLSLFCFSMSFMRRLADENLFLPLHKAWKATYYADEKGISCLAQQPMAWKFETFIFDWLTYTSKVAALLYSREKCFAPLKNLTGADSPEAVRAALQQADRTVIESLTGLPAPDFPFELSAEFYYPTSALRERWWGHLVSEPYVNAEEV